MDRNFSNNFFRGIMSETFFMKLRLKQFLFIKKTKREHIGENLKDHQKRKLLTCQSEH